MRPNPFKVINFGKLISSLGWSSLFRVQSGRSMAINPKHQSASAKFVIFRADKLLCLTCCRLAQLVHPRLSSTSALQCCRCSLWEKTLSPAPAQETSRTIRGKRLGSNRIFDKKQESREKKQFASSPVAPQHSPGRDVTQSSSVIWLEEDSLFVQKAKTES